jgi:hypothetical protein
MLCFNSRVSPDAAKYSAIPPQVRLKVPIGLCRSLMVSLVRCGSLCLQRGLQACQLSKLGMEIPCFSHLLAAVIRGRDFP